MSSDSKQEFPKYVYKRGTGKAVSDDGLYTAESALVSSVEELRALAGSWCDSPADAAQGAVPSKKETEVIAKQDAAVIAELTEDLTKASDSRPHKKAK